jgi:hypothetical protein
MMDFFPSNDDTGLISILDDFRLIGVLIGVLMGVYPNSSRTRSLKPHLATTL